jgi:FkbH-like protein
MRIGILSNFSTQFLAKELSNDLALHLIESTIHEAPFGNWELAARNCDADFSAFDSAVVVVCLSLNLVDESNYVDPEFERNVVETLRFLKTWYRGELFLCSIDYPEAARLQVSLLQRVPAINSFLRESAGDVGYKFVDLCGLILSKGLDVWRPGKYLPLAGCHCHPKMYPDIGKKISANIRASKKRLARLVIVDLDNTLWDGIVGDDGVGNIDFSVSGPGAPHRRLQHFLLGLHSMGVLLAICSKNESAVIERVFSEREDLVLKKEHFASIKANWNPKSGNIREILDELNLTQEGTVFLDDSPFERNEVATSLSEILVPDMPEDVYDWSRFLAAQNIFEYPSVTTEDMERNDFYQTERIRNVESKKVAPEDFLKSLELKMEAGEIDPRVCERTLALINKTNQFNINGIRYDVLDFVNLLSNKNVLKYSYTLTDKYSRYGEVSVLVAEITGGSIEILTWVLSCRAFGRRVENVILGHLIDLATSRGLNQIDCKLVHTSKNRPTADALGRIGFVEGVSIDGVTSYSLDVKDTLKMDYFVDFQVS